MPQIGPALIALAVAVVVAACSSAEETTTAESSVETTAESDESADDATTTTTTDSSDETTAGSDGELFPDVLSATATMAADGTWDISATLSSPYDSPERYADAWRVIGTDGTVYGVRELTHDHAAEQPFTRSLDGVTIPDDEEHVTIEGRDQISGWGGQTATIPLER